MVFVVSGSALAAMLGTGKGIPKSDYVQLISYPGWDELIKDLSVKTPEEALKECADSLKAEWDKLVSPHSPLTPEAAHSKADAFVAATNLAYGALVALVTAAEAAGFGQIETPAMMLPNAPAVRASLNAAEACTRAYLDASIVQGVRYYAAALHQPTILPENVLLDAYCKGLIDDATFQGQMMYHGYTTERSVIYGKSGFRMPDIGTLLELARRGILSEQGFVDWGKFHRIPESTLRAVFKLKEQIPEPYRLADFAVKGSATITDVIGGFGWFGISEKWARSWIESQYSAPDLGSILELLRRGLIKDDVAKRMLTQAAIRSEWQDALLSLKKRLVDVGTLAEITARGLLAEKTAESYAKQLGYEAGEWNIYLESARRWPELSVIFELLWRGVIDEKTAKELMRRLGFSADIVEKVIALKEPIPSTSDLVTMVVREAFVPEMVTEAPKEFAYWMAKRGWSKEWSDRYWTAHWRPIPLELAYDNLRRGYWSEDEFRRALWVHDIHPKWHDSILAVAFNPPSLRELGYGYDVGAYTREDIVKYRRWAGLSKEDAEKAADALIAYRTEAEREACRREYMYLYAIGRISREEFEANLKRLGTNPEAVKLWLERGDLYKERIRKEPPVTEPKAITRSDAMWAFEHGLRDERWLRDVLAFLDYRPEDIEVYVEIAKKRKAELEKPPPEPTPRKLTIAQLEDAYWLGLISEDEVVKRLIDLGFSSEDANTLLKIIVSTPPSYTRAKAFTRGDISALYRYELFDEEDVFNAYVEMGYDDFHAGLLTLLERLDDMVPKLRVLYEKGVINDRELYDALYNLGLTAEQAERLTKRIIWELQIERIKEERSLTKSEIIKGVKNGVFTFSQGVELLKGLGYSDIEAQYILLIGGVVAAGDPQGYWEMRRIVELMKKARGEPYREIPDEVIMQERLIAEQRAKIEKMRAEGVPEEDIAPEIGKLAEMEATMRKLLKKYLLVT